MRNPYKVYRVGELIKIPKGSGYVNGAINRINLDASYSTSIPPMIIIDGKLFFTDDFEGVEVYLEKEKDKSKLVILVAEDAKLKERSMLLI